MHPHARVAPAEATGEGGPNHGAAHVGRRVADHRLQRFLRANNPGCRRNFGRKNRRGPGVETALADHRVGLIGLHILQQGDCRRRGQQIIAIKQVTERITRRRKPGIDRLARPVILNMNNAQPRILRRFSLGIGPDPIGRGGIDDDKLIGFEPLLGANRGENGGEMGAFAEGIDDVGDHGAALS